MEHTTEITLSTDLLQLITTDQAWHYGIIPKSNGEKAMVFYANESTWGATHQEALEMLLGVKVSVELMPSTVINAALGKYYRKSARKDNQVRGNFNPNSEDFIFQLIAEADSIDSSDIHIERYEDRCRIRFRIDGKLLERYVIEKGDYPAIINKMKIMANLDIAEKRLPQDGRISFNRNQQKFDIRVSVLPTLHGEKIVMRLLSKDATDINIEKLGFKQDQLASYLEGIKKPHGIILISGPTGSGKTTTLYATLKILNEDKTNILTVEDPIEYTLEGINQVQLKENIGLTFAGALRSFLRQDPDVIMLGEIRDGETAQMAIRAALTGHLVLSTIHTNSAWGTISRLIDMGVPSFLLASTLNTSVAQRLVRLLCSNCKQVAPFNESLFPSTFKAPKTVQEHYQSVGCEECYYSGYLGRKAIYEIIPVDLEISQKIKQNDFNIEQLLKEKGIETLSDNAFQLFANGETSIEEIYAILTTNNQ
ncbi:GspE/PulE family protein [Acidiluteibacter ferrifornacis]|nr:GspE/PulE family protein [Acidiluteibacter ferrifornacis]